MKPGDYTIVLRAESGDHGSLKWRLAQALKVLKRAYGLRCVSIEPAKDDQTTAKEATQPPWFA